MKILFDQNISFRVIKKISSVYPDAKQVRELGLENSSDWEIWQFAKREGYAIATFDEDFYELSNLHGSLPKIIWLRTGNTTTQAIAELFFEKRDSIELFLQSQNNDITCLEIL